MKPKIARRILRKHNWQMLRGDDFSPSKKKSIKEAIRVATKAEVER